MENAFVKLTMLWAPPHELEYSTQVHVRQYLAPNPMVHEWAAKELAVLMSHPDFFEFMRNHPLGFYSVLFHMGLHKDHEGGGPDGIIMGNHFMVKRLKKEDVATGILYVYRDSAHSRLWPEPQKEAA